MPLNIYQFHPKVLISGEFQNHGQNNLKKVSVHGTGNKNNIYHQIHVHMLQGIHADIVTDHTDQRPAWDLYKSTRVQFYHPRCTQAQRQDTTQIKDQLGNSTNLLVRVQFYHPQCTQAQCQDTMQIKDQLGISTNLPV